MSAASLLERKSHSWRASRTPQTPMSLLERNPGWTAALTPSKSSHLGYVAYRRDRPSDSHGGVFILVSSKFESCQPEKLQLQSESEMVWVKISVRGVKDLYVCSFYKKPALRQPGCFSYLETCLQMIPPDSHIWVGGDFNLPDIDWETDTVRPYGQQTTISNELLSTVQNAHLVQMVEEPTRVTDDTSTTPDLFFTSNKSLINTVKIIPGISDHDIVYI